MTNARQIRPSVLAPEILCAEIVPPPCALVVFGASGDLTQRKLLPSLFELSRRDLLAEQFYLLGCGRKDISDVSFRQIAKEAIGKSSAGVTSSQIKAFADRLYYFTGDYDDDAFYAALKKKIAELDKKHNIDGSHIFYLSVPPVLYTTIVEHLSSSSLTCARESVPEGKVRLIVEKPFGRDLQSAIELNTKISRCFDESQVYRIDHYLGKETVQNILMFRFANVIFEPVWNRNYIDSVQLTIAEKLGVEHRASYYDKSGALRDIFQNHMLQILTLMAMEPPTSFEAEHLRDEKVKVLRAIRPFGLNTLDEFIVRGQYGPGMVDGKSVPGYRDEPGVDPRSKTETFVAAKVFIDNWRWKGVPFYLRTGKRLAAKDTEIAITFKKVPHSMFISAGLEDIPPNVLVLQIQPAEGISLNFQAKRPGSKVCMSTLRMSFSYSEIFGTEAPEAYQRLMLDCMVGDQTLFSRQDDAEVTWRLLTPVLEAWQKADSQPYEYPAGSESFPQADRLIESDGRKWRSLTQI